MFEHDLKKAWDRKWDRMRSQYLEGRLPDYSVVPAGDCASGWRWECTACGATGSVVSTETWAATTGGKHVQVHLTDEDSEVLEELKVKTMPEELLSPFQRRRRANLLSNEESG